MKHILWVEDEFDAIMEIVCALKAMGHDIFLVPTKRAAERLLDDGWRGDLVILDSLLPNDEGTQAHDGCLLFTKLRSGERWGQWGVDVKVLFITAYSPTVMENTLGMVPQPAILPKPTESQEALLLLEKHVKGIIINAHSGAQVAISLMGAASITSTDSATVAALTAGDLASIAMWASCLMRESRAESREAAPLLLGIAACQENQDTQKKAVESFRDWLSAKGDAVREGLKTSAAIATLSNLALRILGLI
jgi:CheY-like chemotaxis protein